MRAVDSFRIFICCLLTRFGIKCNQLSVLNIDRIDSSITAKFQIMKRSLEQFIHFPHCYCGSSSKPCWSWWWHKSWPLFDGVSFVRFHQSRNDGFFCMWKQPAESIHPSQHGLPVNRLFWSSKTHRSNLMAVGTHHFEIELGM